ncbi:tyrosine recombinase XerC [Euzebya sp.]|uniref:site-specific integrase n=1 Tax=Euzebya sp. TaxID=1971409 RepID=UPI0035192265
MLQAELEAHGERLAEPDLTLAAYLEQTWLPRLEARAARGEIRPQTADLYAQRARTWVIPTIGQVKLRDLRPRHVEMLLDAVTRAGRKPGTANRSKAVLSLALGDARRAGFPVTNVAADVRSLPERRGEPVVATPERARHLLDLVADDQFGIAVVLMAVLGLRVGEALGLAWSDVDLDGPTVRIRRQARRYGGRMTFPDVKSAASRRMIVLPEVVVEALVAHRGRQAAARATAPVWTDPEPGPLVVTSAVGTAVEVGNLRRWWVDVREGAALPGMRLHDLRHSAATFALAAGASVREVADLLGHADGGALVLSRYGHVLDERRRLNAARLNRVFTQEGGAGGAVPSET